MMRLNVEEMNLLYMFDTSSRKAAVQDILDRFPFLENEELKEICQQTVMKLEHMTDDDAWALLFFLHLFSSHSRHPFQQSGTPGAAERRTAAW